MEYILTKSGVLPKLGLGTYSVPVQKLQEIIPTALDIGYTLFDTANKYNNEAIIGEILTSIGRNRKEYLLETKVHSELLLGNLRYLRLNKKSPMLTFRNACKNFQTEYIDVFMIHGIFKSYEKFISKLFTLKNFGLIGYVGLCNANLNQLKQLGAMNLLPDVVQVEIHPYYSNKSVIEFCHKNSVVVEARSPFAHGDAMKDWVNEPILKHIAESHHATIPQIILRWITQQNVIGLPRTSNIEHLKENINSFKISLSRNEIQAINTLNKDRSYGYVSLMN